MVDVNSDKDAGLFGWVPEERRGQGRPPFVWTREKSNKVMVLFAGNHKPRKVAQVIGCDVKTLRKVFSRECQHRENAALLLRSGMMARLLDEVEKGSVAAVKQVDKMVLAEQLKVQAEALPASRKAKAPPLGKKVQEKMAAESLLGRFGVRPAPMPLIN